MINEKNDADILRDVYPSINQGPNPEEPQFRRFGQGVPKTDGKTIACIGLGALVAIYFCSWLLGL